MTSTACFHAAVAAGMWTTVPRLARYAAFLFADVPLGQRRVLDIGGGSGVFSLAAAAAGAERVVCLEPEAAGSTAGGRRRFERVRDDLGLHNAAMLPQTLQDFTEEPASFDVILLHNSVNHLDEWACIHLRRSPAAMERYRTLFAKLSRLAADRADLVIADVSPANLFPRLGLKNPFVPSIEWHKHQSPRTWARLLQTCGFSGKRVRWSSFNTLGRWGRLLFGNRVAAFFLMSHFVLNMRKDSAP
jgi:SAM-dependent methyltransferase